MSPDTPISLLVKLQFADIYSASFIATARLFRFLLIGVGMIVVFSAALLVSLIFHPNPRLDRHEVMFQLRPLPWLIAALAFLLLVLPALNAWKMLKDPRVKNGYRYSFSDSGMGFESSVTKATVKWAAFLKATESASAFLLYTSKNAAHSLPKRSFASDQDIAALRDLLRTHIVKTKLRQS